VPYVPDIDQFMETVLNKTVVPYQVEIQPGRIKGKNICWLTCSYCYGGQSPQTADRLSPDRYVDLMHQIAKGPHGGVRKIIFAGYATDPLNYEHIDDLVAAAQENGQITGFNTKAIRISDRLVDLLADKNSAATSYFNISVDAGSPEKYNQVHDVAAKTDIYHKVLDNLSRVATKRDANGASRDLSVSYLITRLNNDNAEIENAIRDISAAGADLIRFTFPQLPRGMDSEAGSIVPARDEARQIFDRVAPMIREMSTDRTRTLILDMDAKFNVVPRRILPCVARFVFPTIGFDGFMYHCSQSSAPQFRDLALGNMEQRDFWDAYYDYNVDEFWETMQRESYSVMDRLDCRCDRKEQCVNAMFADKL
jgi:MoaA/NifB/PqqE/SkfB family radical SAM enzyme